MQVHGKQFDYTQDSQACTCIGLHTDGVVSCMYKWFVQGSAVDEESTGWREVEAHEQEPTDREAGIKIQSLTKIYDQVVIRAPVDTLGMARVILFHVASQKLPLSLKNTSNIHMPTYL